MAVEPAITAAIASGNVPSEITAEYLMENRDHPAIVAILVIVVLTFIVVMARCFSRYFLVKSFGLDDGLAFLSVLLQIAFTVLCVILINLGSGRHIEYIQYVLTESQTNITESLDFVAHLIYTSALFVCRLSGLTFYYRLCGHHDKLSIAVKCTVVFLIAAYIPQICLIIFHCRPVTGLWPYAWQPESPNFVCLSWGIVYSVNSALSLTCDILLFAIPAAMIKSLKVSKRRKIQLSFVLFPGVLVIIISCVRVYLVVKGQWVTDGSWYYDPMLAIETSEIGGTLIALSVPGLKPLFGSWFAHINGDEYKPQTGSGTISYPMHMMRGRTQLSSGKDIVPASQTTIKARSNDRNDSDDSLLDGLRIQVHKELNIESKNENILIESHPKNW